MTGFLVHTNHGTHVRKAIKRDSKINKLALRKQSSHNLLLNKPAAGINHIIPRDIIISTKG